MKALKLLWLVVGFILSVAAHDPSPWQSERNGCRKVALDQQSVTQCPDGYGWTCRKAGIKDIPEFPDYNSSSKLCMIDLSKNMLHELYNDSFVNVTDVLWLWLYDNNIYWIDSDSFVGLNKLLWLDLRRNPLYYPSSFSAGVFKPLINLENVNLKSSKPDQSYDGIVDLLQPLKNLGELYISGCYGCTFEEGFENLTSLRNLSLSGRNKEVCNIPVLRNSTFLHLPQVRRLYMSSCKLTEVEIMALTPLKELDFLDIAYNHQLKFAGLHNVLKSLKNSRIELINANNIHPQFETGTVLKKDDIEPIQDLKTLTHLYMDLNKIEVIDKEVFGLIPHSVFVFTLAGNRLSYGRYVYHLEDMKHVEYLDISRQHLHYDPFYQDRHDPVPEYGVQTNVMSYPNADYTNVHSVADIGQHTTPQSKRKFDWVQKGLFSSESISPTFPSSVISKNFLDTSFNCTVCLLECKTNKIACMCPPPNLKTVLWKKSFLDFNLYSFKVCGGSPHLETVDLSFNLIHEWIGPIYGLEELKNLNLAANFCDNMTTYFFDNMPKLQKLNLSHNVLGSILHPMGKDADKHFKNLKHLEVLDLSENRITALHSNSFQKLEHLRYLYLSKNMLSEWNITLLTRYLTFLDLSDNKLDSLPKTFRESLDELANSGESWNRTDKIVVDLRGNPIQCKCDDRPFLRWLSDSPVTIILRKTDECHLQNGRRVPLHDLSIIPDIVKQLDVDCVPYIFIAISLCIFVVSIISCIVIYRFRWKLRHIYYKRCKRHHHKGYDRLFEWDAFVSYANTEGNFIKNKMVPAIEGETKSMKLWVADRDSQAGASVAENLTHAIYSSKKTVVLLSKSYFKDNWCNYEMNMARVESVETNRKLLIIILYEDISPKEIPLDYLRLLRSEQSIEYPTHPQDLDTFWTSLSQAIQSE